MSYSIYSDGHAYQMASATGYIRLVKAVGSHGGKALLSFFSEGETNDIDSVKSDLDQLIGKVSDVEVKEGLQNLREVLNKCKGTATIAD